MAVTLIRYILLNLFFLGWSLTNKTLELFVISLLLAMVCIAVSLIGWLAVVMRLFEFLMG